MKRLTLLLLLYLILASAFAARGTTTTLSGTTTVTGTMQSGSGGVIHATDALTSGSATVSGSAVLSGSATNAAAALTSGSSTVSGSASQSGAAGYAAVSGSAALSGGAPLAPADSRAARVAYLEGTTLAASGTQALLSISGSGAGNAEMIQIAFSSLGGTDAALLYQSKVQIIVDGTNSSVADFGTFFCVNGSLGTDMDTFKSDDLGVSCNQGQSLMSIGAYRRIFIPFNTSLTINLINGSATNSGNIFSQVTYRLGTPPITAYGYHKGTFHMAYMAPTTVAQYASFNLLNVTGSGVIDSVQLCESSTTASAPYWFEGNPNLTLDSVSYTYGGTEDIFGNQYYGTGGPQFVTESWGIPIARPLPGGGFATSAYRFFRKDPMQFNSSAVVTFVNGQSGEASPPGSITASGLVIYFLQ